MACECARIECVGENQTTISAEPIPYVGLPKKQRGGRREGAGRKPLDVNARYLAARGISPLKAAEILAQVADERALWRKVLSTNDDRVLLQALMFLVSMRDGRPAQQINVSSIGVHITADEVAKAREIVRELMAGHSPSLRPQTNSESSNVTSGHPLMLSDGEGGKEGGEVG